MSFTTQSASVPSVEAMRFAIACPLIFTGAVSASVRKVRTSVRPDASRWSSTSQRGQVCTSSYPVGNVGRARNGTGFAGSDTYSSYAAAPATGAA